MEISHPGKAGKSLLLKTAAAGVPSLMASAPSRPSHYSKSSTRSPPLRFQEESEIGCYYDLLGDGGRAVTTLGTIL